jgi:hypothetical protein
LDVVSQWLDTAQAVPTKETIVAEHATQANELKDAIMSSRANTRSIIATSTDTINPDIAVSSEMDLSSGIFGVPVHVSKKAKTVSPEGKTKTASSTKHISPDDKKGYMKTKNAPVSDLIIVDIFKTAFALSQTELSVNHIQRLDDELSILEIPEATVCNLQHAATQILKIFCPIDEDGNLNVTHFDSLGRKRIAKWKHVPMGRSLAKEDTTKKTSVNSFCYRLTADLLSVLSLA